MTAPGVPMCSSVEQYHDVQPLADTKRANRWRVVGRRIQVKVLASEGSKTRSRLFLAQRSSGRSGTPVSLATLTRVEGALGFRVHEIVSQVFGGPLQGISPTT